jgi:hypothetical protein
LCASDARPISSGRAGNITATPTVELLLRELLTEVRGLRADLRERQATSLSRADRALLARLLPAIGGALGSEPFPSRDLPTASPGLRVVLRGVSAKQIGRLLSRAEGVPIDGYIVERCGIEINVTLWRVVGSFA